MSEVTTRTAAPTVVAHVRSSLGAWPAGPGTVVVATSPARNAPGWDGRVVAVIGLETQFGTIVSVPPQLVEQVTGAASDHGGLDAIQAVLGDRLGLAAPQRVVHRWLAPGDSVADLDDVGQWWPARRAGDPEWLAPFNGGVLVATVDGRHAGAVGVKAHDEHAAEIAVVTSPAHRGSGVGRRLVAQATRSILASGRAALYLHLPGNAASAAVAEAVGFPDDGWRQLDWPAAGAPAGGTAASPSPG